MVNKPDIVLRAVTNTGSLEVSSSTFVAFSLFFGMIKKSIPHKSQMTHMLMTCLIDICNEEIIVSM